MSKRKIRAILIAVFVTVVASASVISYSLATKERKGLEDSINQNYVASYGADSNLGNMDYISNIDMIIKHSNEESDYTYNIVELIPGSEASSYTSGLKEYINSGGFKKYVIDSNKSSATNTMADNKINYKSVVIKTDTTLTSKISASDDTTVQDVLNSADLIYLASPNYESYTTTKNMPEEIYNWLHNYALEKDNEKPIIFDYVTKNTTTTVESKTYKSFVNDVSSNYIKYRTYSWDINGGVTAENFFKSDGSYYITFNGNKKTPTGNVLVISSSSDAGTLESALGNGDVIKNTAYYGKRPSKITITRKNPTWIDSNLDSLAPGNYDFIIIEDNVASSNMSANTYNTLKRLSETSNYIIYNSSMLSSSSGNTSEAGMSNYHKFISLLVNGDGIAKYNTVLPVTNSFFGNLNSAGENGLEAAKSVADIIDYGSYRGNKGGEGSKKFRVLEIEPCYPVDTELATRQLSSKGLENGGYYTDPDGVLYGVTKDEIPEDTEYFAFEISKAKIAHATGLNYNQIQVDQMSANEFISSKEVVAESYDLVYIGGDYSALRTHKDLSYGIDGRNGITELYDKMAVFDMYTHTGYWYSLPTDSAGYIGDKTVAEMNGNDITVLKLDELTDYVDAGMPVIIDKAVGDAFLESYQYDKQNEDASNASRLEQLKLKNIDPDSNMYKFLVYAYKKYQAQNVQNSNLTKNICFGEFSTKAEDSVIQVDNADRTLGNTLGSYATVYNTDISTKIANLINQSSTRPTLVVSNKPVDYVEGDTSTVNTDTTMTISCSVKSPNGDGSKLTLALYVDKNGDNTFSENELVGDTDGGVGEVSYVVGTTGTVDLTYGLPEDFFGLVSWKVVATVLNDKGEKTTICDTATGYAYFKPDKLMKKTVRVLQISPVENQTARGANSQKLYFCTECEQAQRLVTGNIYLANAANFQGHSAGYDGVTGDSNGIKSFKGTDINFGLHEHNFGITKYDPNIGDDDWEANFADSLTHGSDGLLESGDFDFDLEIITPSQFNSYCKKVNELSEEEGEAYKGLASQKLLDVKAREQSTTYQTLKDNLKKSMIYYVENYSNTINHQKCRDAIKEGVGTSSEPGQWMLDERFYKFWEYYSENYVSVTPNISAAQDTAAYALADLIDKWNAYIKEHDEIVTLKKEYEDLSHKAGTADTWLKNSYDMIVLGFANDFGNNDLSNDPDINATGQLKSYIDAGGAVLNTHDTMTKYKGKGSVNLTNELREAFGMDRYHVEDGSTSNKVTLSYEVPAVVSGKIKVSAASSANQYYQGNGAFDITYTNKDVEASVSYAWDGTFNGTASISETETIHNDITEKVHITIDIGSSGANKTISYMIGDSNVYKQVTADANGIVSIDVDQVIGTQSYDVTFNASANSLTGTWDVTGQTIDIEKGAATTDKKCKVELNVVDNGSPVADNSQVKVNYRNTTTNKTVSDGKLSLELDLKQKGTSSIYTAQTTGSKYRKYSTKDSSKYFFTERAIVDDGNYAAWEASVGSASTGYNSPIGFTDAYIGYKSPNPLDNRLPYKYTWISDEIFNAVDGDYNSYDWKYGTRRASQVNKGSVTVYPFTISSELTIAATHAQAYALDMEDDSICVWYALGGTMSNDVFGTNENAHKFTSAFAASPRDGMNNYFLCSKDNVFYCGAGHAEVTGYHRDNNDERRLFINVIVSSVTKAKKQPTIKLYNACDESGDKHDSCDDNLVSKNGDDNKKLSKKKNILFYNDAIGMYQYNIEEDQEYPLFDFKLIEGNVDFEKVDVFYDLNYGSGDGKDISDLYTNDSNHVLLSDYTDKSVSDISGARCRLRETTTNLKLKDEYFSSSNTTYIVIYATDKNGEVVSARVMIKRIPYLFDLTDATIQNRHQSFTTVRFLMDVTDRTKFNI